MKDARSALSIPQAFALAFAQLGDRKVLALLVKSILISIVLAVLLGAALVLSLGWGIGAVFGLDYDQQVPGAGAAMIVVLGFVGIIAAWLAWRIVAIAVLQFYADDVVSLVEAAHYPSLAPRDLPMAEQARIAVRGAIRALVANLIALPFALALLFTAIGPALVFAVVNGILLGRELQDMVWVRHQRDGAAAPLGFASRFLLGLSVAGLLAVPILNLLAPFLGAAAATHLVHRAALRQGASHA
ncbi:EI24 domain-containing protein [Croceicoccus bisphenolivorans]|uniref:EI24 domain-containing protein n=1 Tax=Croceicoccus bisphenolivorans TaxID=1783232 RepID=UPI0009ED1937|nr:EI24 domain-containing protein [Croceicoccus bisphenolivorans]